MRSSSFCFRHWSVVVLDSSMSLLNKNILHLPFSCRWVRADSWCVVRRPSSVFSSVQGPGCVSTQRCISLLQLQYFHCVFILIVVTSRRGRHTESPPLGDSLWTETPDESPQIDAGPRNRKWQSGFCEDRINDTCADDTVVCIESWRIRRREDFRGVGKMNLNSCYFLSLN